jgi:hypothetical protein
MATDNAHMNNHAGIRFRKAIARAGKSSRGIDAIHELLLGVVLGGVEVEANVCFSGALASIYRAARQTTIGGPDPQVPQAIAISRPRESSFCARAALG